MNEVFKTEDAELPSCEWSNNFPFLAPNRGKMSTTLCHGHFTLCEYLPSPTLKAQPPTPRATEPSLPLSLPHKQCTHLLPPVRLWFSIFCSILPPAACTFLCSPTTCSTTSPRFQQLSRDSSPFPLMAAPDADRAAPVRLSHPQFPICEGTIFFKLHFTSKSRAQLLVWVQSQETLRCMGEGS